MKTILLAVFCALALSVQARDIKKDTIDSYIIDQHVIDRFNGSQLEGKTISRYMIAYKNAGAVVERIHIIYTEAKTLSTNVNLQGFKNRLIIVDGKETPINVISSLKSDEIAGIEVYKAGSKVAKSYGGKGVNGVVVIKTKANKSSSNVYFIDGRRVNISEVEQLSPNKIVSVNVNKEDGVSVIEITTKK